MANSNRPEEGQENERGGGGRFWKGLPYTLMGLAVFLFLLTIVINVPATVTLKQGAVIFADSALNIAKEQMPVAMTFDIATANWFAYKLKDNKGATVGWVPKTKTSGDKALSFMLLFSCVFFVIGLNLWAVSLRTQRYVSGPPVSITIQGGYSASVRLKVRYSFSVSLGGPFLHDLGRLVRSAMVGRNILSVMESLGALIAKRAAEFTSAQARQEIPEMVEGFNRALRVFNQEGVTAENEVFLADSLSTDVLDQLRTVYVPIDQIIVVVDLAAETVEAERGVARARTEDITAMPVLEFGVQFGYIGQEQAEAIQEMSLNERREFLDWLGAKKQEFVEQRVAMLSAESGGREAEAKAILARRASEGLELAKTGGGDTITRAIEFIKALLAG